LQSVIETRRPKVAADEDGDARLNRRPYQLLADVFHLDVADPLILVGETRPLFALQVRGDQVELLARPGASQPDGPLARKALDSTALVKLNLLIVGERQPAEHPDAAVDSQRE